MHYLHKEFQPHSNIVNRTIAWIDNTIEKFDEFMESFSNYDTRVCAARSATNFLQHYKSEPIDHLFLDYDLLGTTGFDDLPRLVKQCNFRNIYICTAYSYKSHIDSKTKEMSRKLGISIGTLPKEMLPWADRPEKVEEFLSELDGGRFAGDLKEVEFADAAITRHEFPSFSEYQRYTFDQRTQLLDLGEETCSELINNAFDDGVVWMLIDPIKGRIVKSVSNIAEIPQSQEVDQYVKEMKLIPLIYSRAWTLDSIDNLCDSNADIKSYSTLGIQRDVGLKSNKQKDSMEFIHFDSGNSFSLFAYEYFLEEGWIEGLIYPAKHKQGDLTFYGEVVTLEKTTVSDSAGNSAFGDLRGFAVMRWSTHRVALACTNSCAHGIPYPAHRDFILCSRRKGLLGRNLGAEIKCKFALDTRNGEVELIKDAEV